MKVQTSKNTYLIRWQMQWKLDGLPLPPSSLVENFPRRQSSTSSKPQCPNEPEKRVRGLFMAIFLIFNEQGDILHRLAIFSEYIAMFECVAIFYFFRNVSRYFSGDISPTPLTRDISRCRRYIADICNLWSIPWNT